MALLILNFVVRWDGWSMPYSGPFPPEQNRVTHCRGGRVSPRASPDGCGEVKVYSPHLVSNPNHPAPTIEPHQHNLTFSLSGLCLLGLQSHEKVSVSDLIVFIYLIKYSQLHRICRTEQKGKQRMIHTMCHGTVWSYLKWAHIHHHIPTVAENIDDAQSI